MPDGTEKPITFISRMLNVAEKKYSQLEKEALAIVFAVRKLHHYLYGLHFTLYSDHKPLQYLLNESRQIPILASSRIQRWALTLAAYSYTIKHKPGTQLAKVEFGLSQFFYSKLGHRHNTYNLCFLHFLNLSVQFSKSFTHLNALFPSTISLWNSLPPSI